MNRNILGNAFSLQMVEGDVNIYVRDISEETVQTIASRTALYSIVGHADTAAVFSQRLGVEVANNRESITLQTGDALFVGQIMGGRLPEGATSLPEGFSLVWKVVRVESLEEKEWTTPYSPNSIYGALEKKARQIAENVGGEVKIIEDPSGNPRWIVDTPGFRGEIWDD